MLATIRFSADEEHLEICANMLKAIAHPIRMTIIDLLSGHDSLTVTEIHENLGLEQAVASHHLGILRSKGVLQKVRNGKHTRYSLLKKELIEVLTIVAKAARV